MPGVKRRFNSTRSVRSQSINPKIGLRGHLPQLSKLSPRSGIPRLKPDLGLRSPITGVRINPRLGFVEFDRSIITRNWNLINRVPLQRAANLIRIIARGSIRRRTRRYGKPSPPGMPPYSRVAGKTPPFKQIFNVPDFVKSGTRQYIGMVGYRSNPPSELPVPGLHELGGSAQRSVPQKMGKRSGRRWKHGGKFYYKNRIRGAQPRNNAGQYQQYATPYLISRRVKYPMRPFMRPALVKAKSRIPGFWKLAFTRSKARSIFGP